MNANPIKLEIPDELRRRIETFLGELDEAVWQAPENHAFLTAEITTLEADARGLNEEIGRLKNEAATSDKSADRLNKKETRLRQVNAKLNELRTMLDNLKPVTLFGAAEILTDVTRHYFAYLPDAIADFLESLCPTRHRAVMVAKMCECYTVLHSIRNWSFTVNSENAASGNVNRVRAVLQRALRGQAHLGADLQGVAAETAPAAPESGAADSTSEATEQLQQA